MRMATIRKRSQRLIPLEGKSCELCGVNGIKLNRHHTEKNEKAVMILCTKCHASEHMKDGTWGNGLKKTKNCLICGNEFIPNHSKKHTTCSKDCLSELGRRNAMKRWHPQELTDLED